MPANACVISVTSLVVVECCRSFTVILSTVLSAKVCRSTYILICALYSDSVVCGGFLLFLCDNFAPSRWTMYCDQRVCLSPWIPQKPRVQISAIFSVHVTGEPWLGPPLMAMQYVMYTFSFVDDALFSHNGANGLQSVRQVAATGVKSLSPDCILFLNGYYLCAFKIQLLKCCLP